MLWLKTDRLQMAVDLRPLATVLIVLMVFFQ